MKSKLLFLIPIFLLSISSCTTNEINDSAIKGDDNSSTEDNNPSRDEKDDQENEDYNKHILSTYNPTLEPRISNQMYLHQIGDIFNTWKSYQGDGITVAVIDKEFKVNHEDFYFEDGTSKISDKSMKFINGKETPIDFYKDVGDSHGTFCAGIIGAGLNGKGVVGIAPRAKLMLLETDLT